MMAIRGNTNANFDDGLILQSHATQYTIFNENSYKIHMSVLPKLTHWLSEVVFNTVILVFNLISRMLWSMFFILRLPKNVNFNLLIHVS